MLNVKWLSPQDQALARAMTKQPYIQEHRLVMARYLGRPLKPTEIVHHRNDDKADNRLANLRLVTRQTHNTLAPADTIAKLAVEIEDLARQLAAIKTDPTPQLRKCIEELKRALPLSLDCDSA